MCFDLAVVEDTVVEESEVVLVSLSTEDSAVRIPGEGNKLNITIVDNDSKPSNQDHWILVTGTCF